MAQETRKCSNDDVDSTPTTTNAENRNYHDDVIPNNSFPSQVKKANCSEAQRSNGVLKPVDGMSKTTAATSNGLRRNDEKRKRPRYGALKRVTLAVTGTSTSPETIDAKYSIVIVQKQEDSGHAGTDVVSATVVDKDASTPTDVCRRDCRSSSSTLTSPFRRLAPSYGTTSSSSGKLASDSVSCASTAVTVDSNSGTSTVVAATKTPEGLLRRSRSQLCKQYAKKFIALLFSTVGVLSLMVGYTILGGYIFMRLEAPNEVAVKADVRRALRWHVASLWVVTEQLNVLHRSNWTALAERVLDNFTRQVFLATKHRGYEYDVTGEMDDGDGDYQYDEDDAGEVSKLQWNFAGSLLYSITVITTIGYGNIAPKTPAGMVVTMLYAIVGIPLTLFTITNLGRLLATVFRFVYKNLCCIACCVMCRRRRQRKNHSTQPKLAIEAAINASLNTSFLCSAQRGALKADLATVPQEAKSQSDMLISSWRSRLPVIEFVTDVDEIQKVSVPISVSLALITGYVALGSLLFRFCEDWDYLVASYFCFITLSTIGFGDYVPGTSLDAAASQEKMVLCAMYLVFGLAMLAMCFDLMQEEARHKFDSLGRRLGLIDDNDD